MKFLGKLFSFKRAVKRSKLQIFLSLLLLSELTGGLTGYTKPSMPSEIIFLLSGCIGLLLAMTFVNGLYYDESTEELIQAIRNMEGRKR